MTDLTVDAARAKALKTLSGYPEWQVLVELARERVDRYAVSLGKHLLSGADVDQRAVDRRIGHAQFLQWLVSQPERLGERLETDLQRLSAARKDDSA